MVGSCQGIGDVERMVGSQLFRKDAAARRSDAVREGREDRWDGMSCLFHSPTECRIHIHVRPGGNESVRYLGAAKRGGKVQWSLSVLVSRVHICFRFEERLGDLFLAVIGRPMQ